jgi:hypothetical protein
LQASLCPHAKKILKIRRKCLFKDVAADVRVSEFQQSVAALFGLVPNFFVSTPDAPEII